MSDIMHPISIEALLNWIFSEYQQDGTIFGIRKFYHADPTKRFRYLEKNGNPLWSSSRSSYTISTKYYCGLFNRFSFLKLRQSDTGWRRFTCE